MTCPVQIVVALPVEAKPVVSRFRLRRTQPDQGFPVYQNQNMSLILSGTGKVNAAAAVRQLHQIGCSSPEAIWINFGIAGHAARALGEAVLARRVLDSASGDCWPVPIGFSPPCETDDLLTVDSPDFEYKTPAAIDMEAAGFFPAAKELSVSGRVHCLKVISDNPESPADRLNGKRVRCLIEDKVDILEKLLHQLQVFN